MDSSGAHEITPRIKKMSIVPKETIEVIAQSIGINNLSPDVALALAPDVEYRMREIMQVVFRFLCNIFDMGLFCHCCFDTCKCHLLFK